MGISTAKIGRPTESVRAIPVGCRKIVLRAAVPALLQCHAPTITKIVETGLPMENARTMPIGCSKIVVRAAVGAGQSHLRKHRNQLRHPAPPHLRRRLRQTPRQWAMVAADSKQIAAIAAKMAPDGVTSLLPIAPNAPAPSTRPVRLRPAAEALEFHHRPHQRPRLLWGHPWRSTDF